MDNYMFPYDKVPRGAKIIIYGATKIAKAYLAQLAALDYCRCLFIADRNYASIQTDFGVEVCNPDSIFRCNYDKIVIAALRSVSVVEIVKLLIKQGVSKEEIVYDENNLAPFTDISAGNGMGEYYTVYRNHPIEENCILYESYFGAGMIDNPYAIFKAIKNTSLFSRYKHIWLIAEESEKLRLEQEYEQYANVIFIPQNGQLAAYYYATSKYLIQNTSFSFYFAKRKEQILLTTWHSITVKTLGFDIPNGAFQSRNVLRCLLQSDYIIAANSFMTGIFLKSYKLQELFKGDLVEEGHPRTDIAINTDRERIINKIVDRNVAFESVKKVILYAPTWKGETFDTTRNDFDLSLCFKQKLQTFIDCDEYQILIKPHHALYRKLTTEQRNSGLFIPPSIDANELLSVVDILISDYSSIFFDYMMLDRPVLFYIPDFKDYKAERGILFDLEELPGPVTSDIKELGQYVKNINDIAPEFRHQYEKIKKWSCKHDDGNVSQRIVDIVFHKKHGYNLISAGAKKIKLLLYPGYLECNEITNSFLALLGAVDYDKFDVSVYCSDNDMDYVDRIPKDVRVFIRCGSPLCTPAEYHSLQALFYNRYPKDCGDSKLINNFFKRDYMRCFGNVDFDIVIDYSGNNPYFPALLKASGTSVSYTYRHDEQIFKENGFDQDTYNIYCIKQFEALLCNADTDKGV